MLRSVPHPVTAAALGIALLTSARTDPLDPEDPAALLRRHIRASDNDLKRLDRGEVLSKTLETPDGREVSSFGAIRVTCTRETFASRVRDIDRFKASEYVLQVGRFQPQPLLQDLAPLALDPNDREAMRTCRAGSCGLRLPADAMSRFRSSIPWGTPEEAPAAAAAMREFLLDETRKYIAGGSAALPDYADRNGAMPRAQAFRALLRPSTFAAEYQPELFRYLDEFPRAPIDGGDSFLYWSRERFGLKPVISVSHSVLLRRENVVVFGSKQVFASHYFESSLGLAMFVAPPGATYGYVTYLNRSRIEGLRGLLAAIVRPIIARRAREGLERMLIDVKRKLEAPEPRAAAGG